MSASYVKMMRGEAGDELIAANPLAFCLAAVIARRARWSDGFNVHNLQPGEAFLGDFGRCGMSEQQYRTAKAQLEKWGFAAFKPTNKGTVAKLEDTRLFSVLPDEPNGQYNGHSNGRLTDGSRTGNGRVTTNYKGIEGKDGHQESQESTSAEALAVYEAYPRHVAKPHALKAIAKALLKMPFEQLLARTQAYAEHCRQSNTAEQYIPHPATWFNGERFNDTLPMPATGEGAVDFHGSRREPRQEDFPGDKAKFDKAYENWVIWQAIS